MICDQCGARLSTSHENHRYRESGLDHVTLIGQEVRRCATCGYDEQVFHRLGPLHRSIALAITDKPTPVAGPEIRFLRGWMGWSGRDFAAYMGVTPATVSRWERGRLAMGPVADRLLRLLTMRQAGEADRSLDAWKDLGRARRPTALRVDTRTLATTWEVRARQPRHKNRAG